jgi:hypothetical protein
MGFSSSPFKTPCGLVQHCPDPARRFREEELMQSQACNSRCKSRSIPPTLKQRASLRRPPKGMNQANCSLVLARHLLVEEGTESPLLSSLNIHLPISTLADFINFCLLYNILCWTQSLSVPPGRVLQKYSLCSVDRVPASFVLSNDSYCSSCSRCSSCSDAGHDIDAGSLFRPGQARQVFSG